MKFRHYELLLLIITSLFGYEYLVLNGLISSQSILALIFKIEGDQLKILLDPSPGYPLSFYLGIAGFAVMCTTNFYILRKRFGFMKNYGKLGGWLDFHIFCGLLGPVLIIFHSNFKVDGLVAISFWSMMICSSSGIVGRYFYIQTLRKNEDLKKSIAKKEEQVKSIKSLQAKPERLEAVFHYIDQSLEAISKTQNIFGVFIKSLFSDIKLMFFKPEKMFAVDHKGAMLIKDLCIEKRRQIFYMPFNRLLGYWHSFHLPFAIFMYVVAILHIVTAILFGVKR